MKTRLILTTAALLSCGWSSGYGQSPSFAQFLGPYVSRATINEAREPDAGLPPVHRWNQIALIATGIDHTPPPMGSRRSAQQLGPARTSRAMAIIHIAIFDSYATIDGGYQTYLPHTRPNGDVSEAAAIAQSAHDTLVYLYSEQKRAFNKYLAEDLSVIPDGDAKTNGIALGQQVAASIIADRTNDGSQVPDPLLGVGYFTSDQPGHWRQDPVSQAPVALGAFWSGVKPFVIESASQFRSPEPPALTDPRYTAAYNQERLIGGDGVSTPTARTPYETYVGIFWAYDGTPSLCAPPRLYNQITVQISDDNGLSEFELAHLLALANVGMADGAIACWDSKYFWDMWRPVTGVRESDPGTGPTGLGDGNPNTIGDPSFSPLGGQATNLNGVNFTPPFPSYPSGHATFGGSLFQIFRRYFGTDDFTFTFVSDEWNGISKDSSGRTRPYVPATFTSFSEAEEQNGMSRVYLGIHWSFDKTAGITQGNQVGDYVFDNVYQPL